MAVFSKLLVASLAICSFASPLVERDASLQVRSSPIAAERRSADFTFAGPRDILPRANGANPDYSQNYIAGGANVQFSPNGNSFSVTFNTNSDFVVGRGWKTGDTTPINFSGSASFTSGVGLLSVYGWSTNPLVEYYIIEDSKNPPQQGTIKGTFTSDGGTYTVWEHQQVNQPCITGNSCTFQQYLSIRQSGRSSGTVTLTNHFNKWASYGMNLGALNYQTISVESWSGAGSVQQTVTKGGSGSTTPPSSTSSSAPSSTSTKPPTGGSCSAIYGQCGGIGWTGATCCASGTKCQQLNSYFYQCLT